MHGCTLEEQRTALAIVNQTSKLPSFLTLWFLKSGWHFARTDAGEIWLKEHPEASKELMDLLSEALEHKESTSKT